MKKMRFTSRGSSSVDELIGVLQQISHPKLGNLGHLHVYVGKEEKSIKHIELYEYEDVTSSEGTIQAIRFILE